MKRFIGVVSLALCASSSSAQQPAAPKASAGPPSVGLKIAYVSIQAIAANSADGKAAAAKVNALIQKKQAEVPKQKPQDTQRFQQDAQAEVQKLQADLQGEFQKKLGPILQQMAQEKHLSMLFSAGDAGLVWADPGLDLTAEAIKRLDAATIAPKPAAK
jgi:Skp family chaperone for outer membrane proteins